MTDSIISFSDFSFTYRSQKSPTLKNINLNIYPGEKILIVGPSGSGKSTLAHCINGLVPCAYEGTITGSYLIDGKDPRELGIFGLSQIVGTVLQDTDGQFVGLTVAEDVAFALENERVPLDQMIQKVDEACEAVDILDLKQNAPRELSGGQKQRVSMAGVLVSDVKVLLFDEPLANLDPKTGKRTIELIDKLNSQGITCIIIEHRLEDALWCRADRIVLVDEGEIRADMSPDKLLASDVLSKAGIREPLYITALKHAGCDIDVASKPSDVRQMDLTQYAQSIQSWNQKVCDIENIIDTESILEVSDLSFSYDGKDNVLTNIGFDIHKGEMVSIVGKNGAGKSTLSSIICGFMPPKSGVIKYKGEDISSLSIKERGERIGFVMQNPNHMISQAFVSDEVALGLKVRGVDEDAIKAKTEEILKICELYPYRNWPVSALSYGMKKRVTIASILTLSPEVIILDEPTAGQDFRRYTQIMEFLKRLNKEHGITIIMVTHDMHLMLEYTSRAIVLADGQMICDSTPEYVLTSEDIADRAYLKKTSLYELAVGTGLDNPQQFVRHFISYEERQREERRDA